MHYPELGELIFKNAQIEKNRFCILAKKKNNNNNNKIKKNELPTIPLYSTAYYDEKRS